MGVNGIGNGFQPAAFPRVGAGKADSTLPQPDPSPVVSVIASRLGGASFREDYRAHRDRGLDIKSSPETTRLARTKSNPGWKPRYPRMM